MLHARYRFLPIKFELGHDYLLTFSVSDAVVPNEYESLKAAYKQDLQQLHKTVCEGESVEEKKQALQQQYFYAYDKLLHLANTNNCLIEPNIASCVADALMQQEPEQWFMYAFCIMPNHVHALVHYPLLASITLEDVLLLVKEQSSQQANNELVAESEFWQAKDSILRIDSEQDFKTTLDFVLQQPVEAGYVERWQDWPHLFLVDNH